MILTLARHVFADDPSWEIIDSSVPLGTEYEFVKGPEDMTIYNKDTGKKRKVSCVLVSGNGSIGWIPINVFGEIK